jgi:hypothetical protein
MLVYLTCCCSAMQETIRANLCKLLEAHPSVINIKVGAAGVELPTLSVKLAKP